MQAKLIDSYFASRPNKEFRHAKIAVLFLACSGSGKSTITEKIVKELHATYLRNDDARLLLNQHHLEVSPKVIIDSTWRQLRHNSENQFIVFDSNMSAYYMHKDSYYNVALELGYRTFIITIDLPKKLLEERMRTRNRYDTEEVLELLPTQLQAQKEAIDHLKPDFTVREDTDYGMVIEALRIFEATV
jgi:predicted kinase